MIKYSKPNIKKADLVGVLENLVSDNIGDGQTVKEFEKIFAFNYKLRSNHAVALSSGYDALFLGLKAMGVGEGDEIIIPSFVCTAPYHAVKNCGATPILADIEDDYNISATSAKEKITENTKAIIVPHMFGQPANLDSFLALDVPLIEDCAQAIGATYKGKPVGSFGKFAIFSFYATKMLTTGYGGMFLSRDSKMTSTVSGMRICENKEELSYSVNSNISDFQAAMGINQLKRLNHFIEIRESIADIYNRKLLQTHHGVPRNYEERKNVYYQYPIRITRSLKDAVKFLKRNNVEVQPLISKPLHQFLGLPAEDFPNTEKAFLKALAVPIYPALLNSEVEHIAKVIAHVK